MVIVYLYILVISGKCVGTFTHQETAVIAFCIVSDNPDKERVI